MKKKRKNSTSYRLILITLICIILWSIFVALDAYIVNHFTSTQIIEETLIVTIGNEEPMYTIHEYSGWVTLTITGKVEQDGEFVHDIFYERADDKIGYLKRFHILEVDGVDPFSVNVPPEYNIEHEYRFLHHVGNEPHQVSLRIKSRDSNNLSHTFTVEVSSENKVHEGGR